MSFLTFVLPFLSPTLMFGTGSEQLCGCLAADRSQSLLPIILPMCNSFSNYNSYFNTCLLQMSSNEVGELELILIIHVIKTIFCPLVLQFVPT